MLFLAAIFRLVLLHDVPPGLSQDEVLNADIVQFIRGGAHALFFREGFGHEPLYHYFSVPFQVLLGDNVLSMRLPAVTLGMLLVALTLRWTRREFGPGTAVLAGVGLAISWWPIVFSRVGIRPILEPVLLLLFAWFWPKRPWLSGLFLGLSLYSYTGARVVFAIPALLALYYFLAPRCRDAEKKYLKAALIVLAVSLLVALPLFLTLWADPTLQQRVDQLAGPLEALRAGDLRPILQSVANTLGVFSFTGDPRWTYTLPDRPLFDWATAAFFYVGLLTALWRWRQPRYALVLVWLGVTLIPSAVTPQSPSTVRLVGAMPVVYLLVGLGVTAVYPALAKTKAFTNRRKSVHPLFSLLLITLLSVNLYRTINDGFIRWPQAEITRLNHYQTILWDIARDWQANPVENLVVAEAFYEPIDRDSLIRNLGRDPQARWVQTGSEVSGAVVLPAEGHGRFYVPEFAAPDPDLLHLAGIEDSPEFRSSTQPSFAIYALPETLPTLQPIDPITLDGAVSLIGHEISPPEPGKPLVIFTLWRVETALPADLSAFIHLVDGAEAIVAQHDGFDAAPPTLQQGDVILQRHLLNLDPTLPEGEYTVYVGLYRRNINQRLLSDVTAADRFMLTTLIIDEK